jgi:hypothetical protein
MAALIRLRVLVLAIIVLGAAAGVALALTGESGPPKEAVSEPTVEPTATAESVPTPFVDLAPTGVHAHEVTGPTPDDLIILETFEGDGRTLGQAIIWRTNGELKTQFPGPFQDVNSAIIDGVQQRSGDRRELGIVYDASAYGSGSPTAMFVLLRLEGDQWRIVWNAADHLADWRSAHGRVEFPQGDLSQLIVRSDSAFGHDSLSGVLFEANAGPHRGFVDTWVREGDGYVRQSAETVPSAYATLAEFLYALGTGDDAGARALVADAALVGTARSLGLDGAIGKNWLIHCDDWTHCLEEGPIGFDPQGGRGEPNALVSFVEQNGQWLISNIQNEPPP